MLDEPTTYLDLSHQVELMKLIQKLNANGKTIIVVLHDLNQACRYCDHLVVLKSGKIAVTGAPEAVFTESLLKDVFDLDAVVIACNTASTHALAELRAHLSIPVIGVVPAIKPAALTTQCNHIVVLATTATVNSTYTASLIRDFASDTQVSLLAADTLVGFAEEKIRSNTVDLPKLKHYLRELTQGIQRFDVAVLACTHFPLLRDEITLCLADNVQLIDSSEAIARRLKQVVPQHSNSQEASSFMSSLPLSEAMVKTLINFGFQRIIPFTET